MRTVPSAVVALLVHLLVGCATPGALPVPGPGPTGVAPPSPTLSVDSATPVAPQGTTAPDFTPAPAGAVLLPQSEASLFGYDAGGIGIASSDGLIDVLVVTGLPTIAYSSVSAFNQAMAPADGSVAYVTGTGGQTEDTLWLYRPNSVPKPLLTVARPARIESVVVSPDGSRIAYSVLHWPPAEPHEDWYEQLWSVGADGTGNTLVSDRTGDSILEPGPFRLAPVAWSRDNSQVYLVANTDSEATPTGLYVADLATGRIDKAKTPPETLWDAMFSADRSRVVYSSFQWVSVGGSLPDAGPPYAIKVAELGTGTVEVLWESEAEFVSNPVWSPDESAVAFSKSRNSLWVIDLASGAVRLVLAGEPDQILQPLAWLSDGRIVALFGDRLMTVSRDGSDPVYLQHGGRILGEVP